MKLKTLKKKIRKLEARLQEGPARLAKLKQKLEALVTVNAAKAERKTAAPARQAVRSSPPPQRETPRLMVKAQAKAAAAEKRSPAKKVKRKLNLSPERRAQLAAAMKARWAAKRAAAEANPQNGVESLSRTGV
jgi:hypothetical protein